MNEFLEKLERELDLVKEKQRLEITEIISKYRENKEDYKVYEILDEISNKYEAVEIPENISKLILNFLKQKSEENDEVATEYLGFFYYYKTYGKVDLKRAYYNFSLGAFKGRIRSLYMIGDMFRDGKYVVLNESEAFKIYKYAEKLLNERENFMDGEIYRRLGDCYLYGIGVEVDFEAAIIYYQKSERSFYKRLKFGDKSVRNSYYRVIKRQDEIRRELEKILWR